MSKKVLDSFHYSSNSEKCSNFKASFDITFIMSFTDEKSINNENSSYEDDSYLFIKTTTKDSSTEEDKFKKIFKTVKVIDKKIQDKKTNLGRKRYLDKKENNNSFKTHNRTSLDNILNKIQTHSINCINDCVNSILDFFKHKENERFLNNYAKIKKKISKKEFKEIKKKQLNEIITTDISGKYSKFPKDYNKILYNSLKEKAEKEKDPNYQALINFLNENFLSFFQDVYYKNKRTINLHKYGLDALIPLSEKVELCEDKIKTFKNLEDKEYKKNYRKCIKDSYFDGKLMFHLEK